MDGVDTRLRAFRLLLGSTANCEVRIFLVRSRYCRSGSGPFLKGKCCNEVGLKAKKRCMGESGMERAFVFAAERAMLAFALDTAERLRMHPGTCAAMANGCARVRKPHAS